MDRKPNGDKNVSLSPSLGDCHLEEDSNPTPPIQASAVFQPVCSRKVKLRSV